MTIIKISKLNVAINQLQMAIDMFLENKDLFCIITLAGAAEEILGQYAKRSNEQTMVDLLTVKLKNEYSITLSDGDFKRNVLNNARNTVKHFNDKESELIELDLEEEALTMLIRAIFNLHSHDKTLTHNTPAFLEWFYKNRKDLLVNN